jgi:hypothetical protein
MHIRRFASILVALATLVIVASCSSVASQQNLAQIAPQDPLGSAHSTGSAHWTGTLMAPNGMSGALDVGGTASLARNGPSGSMATVVIRNATPLGFHPWEVYRGQCGNDANLIGVASAYPWLEVKGDGTATATATLGGELWIGDYHVNVNASPTDKATIIACGNVAAPNGV